MGATVVFKGILQLFISSCILNGLVAVSFTNNNTNDVLRQDDVIFDVSARSSLACGRHCSTRDDCEFFTYIPGVTSQASCRGHASLMTQSSATTSAIGARSYSRMTEVSIAVRVAVSAPHSCADAVAKGLGSTPGVRTLSISSTLPSVDVYCDGEWTVFLQRVNSAENFYRPWSDYVNGFGSRTGAYWMGLEAIHQLTQLEGPQRLRVELTDWDDVTASADYDNFYLTTSADKYRLSNLNFLGGDAGDSLAIYHNGMPFTTFDADNDVLDNGNCAAVFNGAWWFGGCHISNLCGEYKPMGPQTDFAQGLVWRTWKGNYYSVQLATLKIKPA